MPVRRMSMASVKMKALKPSLITMKPLKVPTISPTSRTTAIPRNGFQLVPRPGPSPGRSTADLLITIPPYSFRFPSRGGRFEALDRSDQLMPVPGRLMVLLDQFTFDHDEQPRADAQVLQVVGYQQHRSSAIASRVEPV